MLASNEWDECFDRLMLECVVATLMPTAPGTSLFANIFEAHDPVDTVSQRSPVLDPQDVPRLLARKPEKIEPLPSSEGFVTFMSDLISGGTAPNKAM